jgi:hypothetical protein
VDLVRNFHSGEFAEGGEKIGDVDDIFGDGPRLNCAWPANQ